MPGLARKGTNLTLDPVLLGEARRMGVNVSRAAEAGLRAAAAEAWQRENAEALAASNDWAGQNGLPLAAYRRF